jgi:gliding motility-associated-like protein
MNRIFIFLFLGIILSGLNFKASASHIYGGDIRYEYVSTTGTAHTYKIVLVLYGDCSGGAFPNFLAGNMANTGCQPVVDIYKDGALQNSAALQVVQAESNIEITPVCPDEANNTKCSNPPGTNPGIKKFTYTLNVTLQGTGNWVFVFNSQMGCSSAGRSGQIQNLQNAGGTIMGIYATLNNLNAQNSSPTFTAPPTPFFCVTKPSSYSLGAVDPETDLLYYKMDTAKDLSFGSAFPLTNATYIAPYTPTEPFPYAPGTFSFNQVNGQMNFTPTNPSAQPQFQSIVVNRVYEIRNGDTIGTSSREMTFVFLNNCDNSAPDESLGNPGNSSIIIDNGQQIVQTCEGQTGNITFDIVATDPDGDNITVTSTNLPAGSTGTVTNDGTPNPTFTFSWDISNNVAAGDYTFYVTFTDDGCPLSATKTISQTVRILPFEGGLVTGSQAPCVGDDNGFAYINQVASDTNNYTIIWTNTTGDTLQVAYGHQGDTLFNLVPGVYNVFAFNSKGCSKFFNIGVLEPYYGAAITAADTMGCVNDAFTFLNSSYGDLGTFLWNFGDGSPTTSQANPSHAYTSSGVYTVTLSGVTPIGCRDTATVNIYVDTMYSPSFTISKDSICMGDKISFYPDGGPFLTGVTWNFGGDILTSLTADSIRHTFDQAGTYTVTLNATYRNCPPVTISKDVHIYPFPLVNLGPDSVICLDGPSILLQNLAVNPAEPYRYSWNTGAITPSITVVEEGTYSLTVASQFDCATTESMIVNKDCYIDVPNSFTPNGDGVNDYFFPRQLLGKSILAFKMQVFNRWGQIVFETSKTDGRGWDGKFNDKDQPTGVYIYQINVVLDGNKQEKYTGNVTLLR